MVDNIRKISICEVWKEENLMAMYPIMQAEVNLWWLQGLIRDDTWTIILCRGDIAYVLNNLFETGISDE